MASNPLRHLGETVRNIRDTSQFGRKADTLQELRTLAERSLTDSYDVFVEDLENRANGRSHTVIKNLISEVYRYDYTSLRGDLMQLGRTLQAANVRLSKNRCPVGMVPTSSQANRTLSFPLIITRNGQVCVSSQEQKVTDRQKPSMKDRRKAMQKLSNEQIFRNADVNTTFVDDD